MRPLLAEWQESKAAIGKALAKSRRHGDKAYRDAQAAFVAFLERLKAFRVLDPACGSGNFLYLALKALKDIEHQVNFEAEALGLERQHDGTGPHNVLGIELNEYAAELARVTVWIGELQWRIDKGYAFKTRPVLEPLDHIECRDALLAPVRPEVSKGQRPIALSLSKGRAELVEAPWPTADAVIGNPPFVGDKKMRGELGDEYTEALRAAYKGRVPGGADLVCYWFEKARAQIEVGALLRAGLVATNSIRQGANREVLQRVIGATRIFDAWPDETWVSDGAAVRVSLVSFGHSTQNAQLAAQPVTAIYADLKAVAEGAESLDLTTAQPLPENAGASFFGFCLAGPFTIEAATARAWLRLPNPNGRPNADVLSPIWNGADISRRPDDRWAIDFGAARDANESSLYDSPFAHVLANVKPLRDANKRASRAQRWWLHGETRPGLRRAGEGMPRWIVTSETAKHRYFVWLPKGVAPEHKLVVFSRADDVMFGLLSSRSHNLWAVATGGRLGVGNDPVYSTSKCFLPFPFPAGLTPADTAHQRTETTQPDGALIPADLPPAVRAIAESIAHAAKRLVTLRDAWLNPPEWTERVPEVVPLGMTASPYPDRIVCKPGFEKELAKRTLTNLYNQRPAWLAQAHAQLDAAVAAAYGWADWSASMADDEILRRLLALNRERSGASA